MSTAVETEPQAVAGGSGTVPMKRHIVEKAGGAPTDTALCGALWDRLHPQKGEVCAACLEIYRQKRPGWPLPR